MASSACLQAAQAAVRREESGEASPARPPAAVVVAIDGVSFATDLLFNVEDVRAHCAGGITTQSALLQMLRGRVSLERGYADELSRMAQRSALEQQEEDSAFKDALAALRAQYINTSVQHRLLADNIMEDVVEPLEKFHLYSVQKLQHLTKLATVIKKETKVRQAVRSQIVLPCI
jgi:hypothetical protein